jgi:hypothetical protein
MLNKSARGVLASALLDSLFEHPELFQHRHQMGDSNGVLCIDRVFPETASSELYRLLERTGISFPSVEG